MCRHWKQQLMSLSVLSFCCCLLPAFMCKAKWKVIFNYGALLLNEALLMQASVSDIKDKEATPVAEHKWDSVLPLSATWNYWVIQLTSPFTALNLEICVFYNSGFNYMKIEGYWCLVKRRCLELMCWKQWLKDKFQVISQVRTWDPHSNFIAFQFLAFDFSK